MTPNGSTPDNTRAARSASSVSPDSSALPTRSSLRRAEAAAKAPVAARSKKRGFVTVGVMTLTAGLFGTMALPAFAQTAPGADGGSSASAALSHSRSADGQTVDVADTVVAADASRDGYTATSEAELASAAQAVALASQREAQRAALASTYSSYKGPTAQQVVETVNSSSSTAKPAFSLDAVYQTGLKYLGTPYVYGGATPAGFDCSGFVMYVYAQFGISLPHSVGAQSRLGTPISAAEAVPGDVVVLNDGSHDGIYAGNGMILDAPKPGGVVSVRPLWTSAVHYVRFGV
ncbi:C40 family peptidase [Frigoribacterium sp. 2-23]|uniref:C40 family peptidase n=1 Tax=Frigoribacterium sp. 2-23 TaxID=3415006 RepID=UPI003C6F9B99